MLRLRMRGTKPLLLHTSLWRGAYFIIGYVFMGWHLARRNAGRLEFGKHISIDGLFNDASSAAYVL
jgi:hypothetical protein